MLFVWMNYATLFNSSFVNAVVFAFKVLHGQSINKLKKHLKILWKNRNTNQFSNRKQLFN